MTQKKLRAEASGKSSIVFDLCGFLYIYIYIFWVFSFLHVGLITLVSFFGQMDGFVLPSFESTCILKDKEIIRFVRKFSMPFDGFSLCENEK